MAEAAPDDRQLSSPQLSAGGSDASEEGNPSLGQEEYTEEEMQVAEEFNEGLDTLRDNNKPVINTLTEIARENEFAARAIADTVVANIQNRERVEQKLPLLYLMDSIVKNVGGAFKNRFEGYALDVFLDAYVVTRESQQRRSMMHLLDTWDGVFAAAVVEAIRAAVMQWAQEQQKQHVAAKEAEHAAKRQREQEQQQRAALAAAAAAVGAAGLGVGSAVLPAGAAAAAPTLVEISTGIAQIQQAMSQPGLTPQQLQLYAGNLRLLTQALTTAQQQQQQALLAASVPVGSGLGPAPAAGLPDRAALLARLAAQGVLVPSSNVVGTGGNLGGPGPRPEQEAVPEPPISWDDISPAALRVSRPSVISTLQASTHPFQCKSCALWFSSEADMSAHLDWHFKCNKRRKALAERQRPVFRPWYMTIEEILSTKGGSIEVGSEAASEHSFFALQASQKRGQVGAETVGVPGVPDSSAASTGTTSSVPADDEQETCPVCGERFEEYWDSKLDEWMYRGAKYLADGKTIVHVQCYTAAPPSGILSTGEPPSKKARQT